MPNTAPYTDLRHLSVCQTTSAPGIQGILLFRMSLPLEAPFDALGPQVAVGRIPKTIFVLRLLCMNNF